MALLDLVMRWLDALSEIVWRVGEAWRRRHIVRVTRSQDGFLLDSSVSRDPSLPIGSPTMSMANAGARGRAQFVVLEWPPERTITRTLMTPAQARDFLSGVVANQLDRLSPWPVAQILHGHSATPLADGLAVRILIARRADVEDAVVELGKMGVVVDRVVGLAEVGREPVALWSRSASREDAAARTQMRRLVGGVVGAYVGICAMIVVAASLASGALQEESDALAARKRALEKRADLARTPSAASSLSPTERAWIWKQASTPVVVLLEALSSALPDGAYLESLSVESGKLRISGLAVDAPPLIDAIERTERFSDVHFSGATVRASDGRLLRFGIEAQLAGAPKKGP
jgi:general secretion pathway protein L